MTNMIRHRSQVMQYADTYELQKFACLFT